jgi:hypothetical protein
MTQPRTQITRELDRRTGDGIEVRLVWCQNDAHVTVAVADPRAVRRSRFRYARASMRSRCSSPLRIRGAATSACPDRGLPFVVATTTQEEAAMQHHTDTQPSVPPTRPLEVR